MLDARVLQVNQYLNHGNIRHAKCNDAAGNMLKKYKGCVKFCKNLLQKSICKKTIIEHA